MFTLVFDFLPVIRTSHFGKIKSLLKLFHYNVNFGNSLFLCLMFNDILFYARVLFELIHQLQVIISIIVYQIFFIIALKSNLILQLMFTSFNVNYAYQIFLEMKRDKAIFIKAESIRYRSFFDIGFLSTPLIPNVYTKNLYNKVYT